MPERILYVTRKFPPAVGGMETLAANIFRGLEEITPRPVLVRLGGSARNLFWFLPYALARTAMLVSRRAVTHVICGDPIVHMALRPVLRWKRVRTSVVVHGLDVTLDNAAYQFVLRRTLPKAGRIVAISEASREAAVAAGVEPDRIRVLMPGVEAPMRTTAERTSARDKIHRRLGLDASKFIILTLGRLVRRKGVRWFVTSVLPSLPPGCVYLVAGTGPDLEEVARAAASAGVSERVGLLGRVDESFREDLLAGVDLFAVPNVPVPGDMEGFGLVAIEAAIRGTPVLASRLEGLRDAVTDGVTGFTCEPEDAACYIERITALAKNRQELEASAVRFQSAAREMYGVDTMIRNMPAAFDLDAS